jgi:GTP cyclohydrolase II
MTSSTRIRTQVPLPVRRAADAVAQLVTFDGLADGREHFALVFGDLTALAEPLVRVHSECVTGDVFGSARCDCGAQLDAAIERIAREGGVVVYLRQEGRGIGLRAKAAAYALQDKGLDTFSANEALGLPADARDYRVAAAMLTALGVTRIHLLTANPDKVKSLREAGIALASVTPLELPATDWNRRYLHDKRRRFTKR